MESSDEEKLEREPEIKETPEDKLEELKEVLSEADNSFRSSMTKSVKESKPIIRFLENIDTSVRDEQGKNLKN